MRRAPYEIEPVEGEFGPAMLALTAVKRAFVLAKVRNGLDNTAAYRATGYVGDNANFMGFQLAHDERVQAAIVEETRRLMRSEGPRSVLTLVALRDDKSIKPEVRVKAAVELMNRGGLHPVTEHHQHEYQHVSEAELDRRILSLAAELGMNPEQAKLMLIAPADMQKNAAGVFELAEPEPRELSSDPRQVQQRATRRRRKGMSPEEVAADKKRIQAERSAQLSRERAEHEARRAGTLTDAEAETDPWAEVEY